MLGNEYALYTNRELHLRIEYLESINVKIFHLPGKENIVSNFTSRNISDKEAWNAVDVGIVDLELTNYNVGELLEEQLNDIEILSVIIWKIKIVLGKCQNVARNIYRNQLLSMDCYVILIMVLF